MENAKWEPIRAAKQTLMGNNGAQHLWERYAGTLEGLTSLELLEVVADVSPLAAHPALGGLVQVVLSRLQAQLTREHVAAQERMSAAAEALQRASLVLGQASVDLGKEGAKLSSRTLWLNWLIAALTAATLARDLLH